MHLQMANSTHWTTCHAKVLTEQQKMKRKKGREERRGRGERERRRESAPLLFTHACTPSIVAEASHTKRHE